ncbi:MAG: Uma2 family endonuclease [Defluviitaleaceae bacterium]|nr:Uma2 family endonuclease [Defluviitaleaceae bacterium]
MAALQEQRQPKQQKQTYTDYASWKDDGNRYELIDGVPHMMAAPNFSHQIVLSNLNIIIGSYLKGKNCIAVPSPLDVRLNYNDGDDTVVQPDIAIICDKSKIAQEGIRGIPDMIVEIISPGSAKMDRIIKYKKYESAGVKEYWIVNPTDQTVEAHTLEKGIYRKNVYAKIGSVPITILDGFFVAIEDIFENIHYSYPIEGGAT